MTESILTCLIRVVDGEQVNISIDARNSPQAEINRYWRALTELMIVNAELLAGAAITDTGKPRFANSAEARAWLDALTVDDRGQIYSLIFEGLGLADHAPPRPGEIMDVSPTNNVVVPFTRRH